MAKHRTHSIAFKRQVVQEYLGGETMHGARVVRHARTITFQLVAVTAPMVRAILAAIRQLRAPPPCA